MHKIILKTILNKTNNYKILFFFQLSAQQTYSEFQHEIWDLLNKNGNFNNIADSQTYRQIRYYSVIGPAALPPEELDRVRFNIHYVTLS